MIEQSLATGEIVPASPQDNSGVALRNAIRLWAEQTTRPETHERDSKLGDKRQAVTRFFAFVGKHPGEVTTLDVEAWRAHLEAAGNKATTIYTRISRLSSFYKWLMADPQLGLYIRSNPAAQASPGFPRPYQSESVKAWTDEEMNALLAVVKQSADAGSVIGKRDYALLLFYLFTGLRRNEVIQLRGKDLQWKEDRLIIGYKRKGGKFAGREVSDPTLREAVEDYLQSAKRTEVMKTGGPLWTRHDRAGAPGAGLSSRSFANNLKKYAKAAGIESVHLHQTRHTYARIVAEETGSFVETQEALDHENAATTRVYVQRITVKADKHSRSIARRINRNPASV
ncbi:MAG: tyrosine-type recombinase/integrase [Blastocatellia bacterium]